MNIEYNKLQFMIFREDVLDCIYSIVKSIEEDNIQTNINYKEYLTNLYKDFKLYMIIKFINDIANDNEFKTHKKTYQIALNYCNDIIENNIIKKFISSENINSNKEKVE